MPTPPATHSDPPLLAARAVSKRFPGVQALSGVDLDLAAGEILAVIGENGAGKSTLMKILAGVHQPDEGTLILDGAPVEIDSVRRATALGVVLIHQELNLAGNLDVAANIYLGREPRRAGPLALLDRGTMHAGARRILARLGVTCDPRTLVCDLPIGVQQMVEIARALAVDARVLILDEPTSSLSQTETDRLFDVLRELKTQGVGIVYISHRLAEVEQIADRVLGLRDGCNSGQLTPGQINRDAMVRLMVGRDTERFYHHRAHETGRPRLEVRGLVTTSHPAEQIDLAVAAGEIVGVAGLVGAGRTELARALFGIDRPRAGSVLVDGAPVSPGRPAAAMTAGMALVPEDRKLAGLVLELSVHANLALASLRELQTASLVRRQATRSLARNAVEQLRIKTPHLAQQVQYLSGGNQQKVVLGKWLARSVSVLILDEPTRGVDLMAKEEIYALMQDLARRGVAILMISSEMQEVLAVSDRIAVMHEGRLAGMLERAAFDEERIMRLATGSVA